MTKFPMPRRLVLGASLALPGLIAGGARAQSNAPLTVLAHRVHQTVATGSQGGDITAPWSRASRVPVQWTTFDQGPLWERLQRETSLPATGVDVGFLLNTQIAPRTAQLFEPLDEWLQRDPIEDLPDIFQGLVEGSRAGGALVAIPFRHASSGLHVNMEFLADRGIAAPPATIEELAEVARRVTHRRSDGTPVTGLVLPGVHYANVVDLARAWNGDFITADFRCVADQPPMLNAIRMLRELFVAGAFPRNFTAISTEDVGTWLQQGRGAMTIQGMSRNRIYNDPQRSRFPGKLHTLALPISGTLRGRFEVAPAKAEFWGMAIPRNSRRKELAWSFIKAMLTREATTAAALNGNGPVRNSTYEDARFREAVPYAEEERRVLRVARVPLPAFDEAPRAGDIFKEEAEAAVLGMKTVEAAMASVVARVNPLLPRAS
jgi:multiple sugar transport system substrate-binding protein